MTLDLAALEHLELRVNGLRLHAVAAGPPDGPLVLLLHGFPEFWYGWRKQLGPLAEAGFRVVAPDQRGYNLSDKPPGVQAYRLDLLAGDVLGLVEALGREQAALVGHDWGAAVAWWVALQHPERVRRLAILNVPHPRVMQRHLSRNPAQWLRSWYILFFQLPRLPEALARAGDWWAMRQGLVGSSRPGTFTPQELQAYREAWSRPGAITAMINWYRALMRHRPRGRAGRVSVPTRILWGARDRFLGREMAADSLEMCERGELFLFEEATHWLQHEEAEAVNRHLLEFLA